LCEIASSSSAGVELEANAVPIREEVKAACEILGMDPLFVANEGRLVAMVAESSADAVLRAMRRMPAGREACRIGRIVAEHGGMVLVKTEVGGSRILDVPFAEQLPRIC
jgi:hydrogenase expression/formation protein HypE